MRLSAPLGQRAEELREQKRETLSFSWNGGMVHKTSVLPHTLEDIRVFSSSTLVHTAG